MIVKFTHENKESRQDHLDSCVYAYNTSKHESSKCTPFELDNLCCLWTFLEPKIAPKTSDVIDISVMEQRHQIWQDIAKDNILTAQARQKEQYDRKHHAPECLQSY